MTDLDTNQIRVDGITLATYARAIETFDGLADVPAVRGGDLTEVWRPGYVPTYNLVPEAKTQRLNIWVAPWDEDGNQTLTPEAHRRKNLAELLAIFRQRSAGIAVEWDVPDLAGGTLTLTNAARVRNAFAPKGDQLRRLTVDLEYPYPYWHAGTEISRAGAASHSFTPGGYAEIWDMVFTFAGDGTLTHDETGDAITVVGSAGPVTVDVGARTIVESGVAARNRARFNRPWWQRWQARDTVTLTVTGTTVAVDYFEATEI